MFKKIILLIFITTLLSNSKIEEYIYDVEIKGISIIAGNVGKCNFKIENNKNQYDMEIITKTTNLAKILYPYVDKIKLKINNHFSLLSIEQKISNRDKKLEIILNSCQQICTLNAIIINSVFVMNHNIINFM